MTDLVWADPPADGRSGNSFAARDIDATTAELKANPDQWAKVREGRSLNAVPWKKRGLEVRLVTTDKVRQRGDIYARWVESPQKTT